MLCVWTEINYNSFQYLVMFKKIHKILKKVLTKFSKSFNKGFQ